MAQYRDELLDHEYDGIRELDNLLPRWWLYLFYVTIVFCPIYLIYYHVLNIGYLQEDEYMLEMNPDYTRSAVTDAKILGVLPEYHTPYYNFPGDQTPRQTYLQGPKNEIVLLTATTDTLVYEVTTDPGMIADGSQTFQRICSPCHGKFGEGIVGPNLTDDYWIHGNNISQIIRSIKYGYPAKGMVPWQGTLKENQIINVASYILTLHGTNPPNARTPQGVLISN